MSVVCCRKRVVGSGGATSCPPSKRTAIGLGRLSLDRAGEVTVQGFNGEVTFERASHCLGQVASIVGVGADDHGSGGRDRDRATAASERLLVDVAVGEDAAIQELAFRGENLPPVGIVLTTRVTGEQGDRKVVPSILTGRCHPDDSEGRSFAGVRVRARFRFRARTRSGGGRIVGFLGRAAERRGAKRNREHEGQGE